MSAYSIPLMTKSVLASISEDKECIVLVGKIIGQCIETVARQNTKVDEQTPTNSAMDAIALVRRMISHFECSGESGSLLNDCRDFVQRHQ